MSDVIQALTLKKPSAQETLAVKRAEVASNAIAEINSFDWKALPPPMMAKLLTQVPFPPAEKDGPPLYLNQIQAMVFAIRCYELGLSPFSNEVWFNPKNHKINVTTEGKQKLARDRGYNLGPPRYQRLTRPWPQTAGNKIANVTEDVGYQCKVSTGKNNEDAEYTAWLSEWYVSRSPMWRDKPEHMLQVRSYEKCISFASGVGSSEMPSENDISHAVESGISSPSDVKVEATEFNYVEPNQEKA